MLCQILPTTVILEKPYLRAAPCHGEFGQIHACAGEGHGLPCRRLLRAARKEGGVVNRWVRALCPYWPDVEARARASRTAGETSSSASGEK